MPHPKPLSEKQLELCTFGDPKCKICRMTPDRIKKTHQLRFEKKWSLKKIAEFLSKNKWCGKDYKTLSAHFKKHVDYKYNEVLSENIEIATIINKGVVIDPTKRDVEKAYNALLEMALDFSSKVDVIRNVAGKRIDDNEVLKEELGNKSILGLMTILSKLQKESISQIASVSALRAPKIMVMDHFKRFIDESISNFNSLLFDIFSMLKDSVIEANSNGGINDDTFSKIFRKAAMEYKNRMSLIRMEQVHDLSKTLSDAEKML